MEFNIVQILDAVAQDRRDGLCLAHRSIERSWSDEWERIGRFGTALAASGIGRSASSGESPHDHIALYLYNGAEYLESMIGSYVAGASAINVNYRYRAPEVAYLLADSDARAIVYHREFAPILSAALDDPLVAGRKRPVLIEVDDGSNHIPVPGSIGYETFLTAGTDRIPDGLRELWSPDDLYICYTGGTTGSPKGVMWRQADFVAAALGVSRRDGTEFESLDELVDTLRRPDLRALPAPPLMHGAAHWNALSCWFGGGAVVIQDQVRRIDADDLLDTVDRHGVTSLLVVGDAFALPLLDALQRRRAVDASGAALPTLRYFMSGGAILSPSTKRQLLDALPGVTITDVLGSTESGRQAVAMQRRDGDRSTGFRPSTTATVLDDTRTRRLDPGTGELGWLAQSGRVPLGYLGDPAKSAATFPVIDGLRYAVAGDRARLAADGTVELLGRESACINTGGEKVFAEEVEAVLKAHPSVGDALVAPVASERFGQEVGAVVTVIGGDALELADLREHGRSRLADFKLPRHLVVVPSIERSPSGKPDYAWAVATLDSSAGGSVTAADDRGGEEPND